MSDQPLEHFDLTGADMVAAAALSRQWRDAEFTDHEAAARLLMSPPKVRALMARLIIHNVATGRIGRCGAGWLVRTYHLMPMRAVFDAFLESRRLP